MTSDRASTSCQNDHEPRINDCTPFQEWNIVLDGKREKEGGREGRRKEVREGGREGGSERRSEGGREWESEGGRE